MPSSVLLTGDWAQLSPDNPRGPRNRTALLLRPDSHSWESRKEFLRAHVFQFQPRMRASTHHEWSELQKGKNRRARLTIPKDCYYTLCQDTLCGIHTAEVSNHFQYYFHTLAFHLQFETSCIVVMSSRIKSDGEKSITEGLSNFGEMNTHWRLLLRIRLLSTNTHFPSPWFPMLFTLQLPKPYKWGHKGKGHGLRLTSCCDASLLMMRC